MEEQINCLRCRHCRLEPNSDLRNLHTVIRCGKLDARQQINLQGCSVADARPMMQEQRYTGGDKPRSATEVEKGFLRAHYSKAPWPFLMRATMRSNKMTVVHIANALGLVRGENTQRRQEAAARIKAARQASGEIFNQAQADYIEGCFARNFWPFKHFGREPYKGRSDAMRAEMVSRVAALDAHGKTWSWESIRSHMKWVSPSYKRNMPARNKKRRPSVDQGERRKKNQRLAKGGLAEVSA